MIFDVFTLVFKSNAKEIIQGNKDAAKSTKDLEGDIKNLGDEADKAGKNYTKLIESATSAAAALISFSAMKAGVLNTAKFNSDLQVQSKILNQNAEDMLAYGAAVEAAGGSVGEFQQFIASATQTAADAGMKLGPFDDYLKRIRNTIKGLSSEEQLRILRLNNITTPGLISILQMTDDEYNNLIRSSKEYARASQETLTASREFEKELSASGQAIKSYWGSINEFVLPLMTGTLKVTRGLVEEFSKDKTAGVLSFATAITAIGTASLFSASKVFGLSTQVGRAIALLTRFGAITTGLMGLGVFGWELGKGILGGVDSTKREGVFHRASRKIAGWMDKDVKSWGSNGNKPQSSKMIDDEELNFWMTEGGYTRSQAIAWVTNRQAENNTGNALTRGDGGAAVGEFQWQNTRGNGFRRDMIREGTGIDVETETDRRKHWEAALWESRNGKTGFNDSVFRSLNNTAAETAYISKNFLYPADGDFTAMRRARMAMDNVSKFPLASMGQNMPGSTGGGTTSVQINEINVNTQATDAEGVASSVGTELQRVLGFAVGNVDDGYDR